MSGSRLSSLLAKGGPVLLSVAVQASLAVLGARIYLAQHNTLQENGNWRTTKTELARSVNEAFLYLRGHQTLTDGRLNLAAWHGFNEVIYREAVDRPTRIEFDFSLEPASWLVVLFDRDRLGSSVGVRLSSHPQHPNAFLDIAADGAFLSREVLASRRVETPAQHHADLRIEPEQVVVRVDGTPIATFPHRTALRPGPGSRAGFGFRGGLHPSTVDNLVVTLASGARVSDDFDAPAARRWVYGLTLPAVLAANLALLAVLRLLGHRGRALHFRFFVANLTLLAMGVVLYRYVLRSGWYPSLDTVQQQREASYGRAAIARAVAAIRAQYGPEPEELCLRVLVVGSSQTWGAGALYHDQSMVRVLETLLAARFSGGPQIERINAGINAARADTLEPLLVSEWLPLRPRVVVFNLSSNDRSTSVRAFSRTIEQMVAAAREAGAIPVLVREANSQDAPATRLLRARHAKLEQVGRRTGTLVIDMHGHLHRFEDQGFLWWDKVHLTPFGQRLAAEKLARELEPLIEPFVAAR